MTKIPDSVRKAFEEKFLLTHYKDGTTERHGLRCKTEELLQFIHSQREEAYEEGFRESEARRENESFKLTEREVEVYKREAREEARKDQTMFHSCLCGKIPTPGEQAVALKELEGVKFLFNDGEQICDCFVEGYQRGSEEAVREILTFMRTLQFVDPHEMRKIYDSVHETFLPTSTNPDSDEN